MPDSAEDNGACRICMDPKDNCVSLFSHDLSKKVMEIADVQVEEDDGLPNSICTECEQDLEKCYEFRLKVQVADKKFRENIKFSKVDIEECNIKEERYVDDGNSDNMDDKDSVSMDDEHCNDVEPDVPPKVTEETEAADPDPLNHVVVVEEKERKVEMSDNPICQDDAMTEEPLEQKIEDVALDPLECMKEEAETEIMDIDSSQPDPFGPSSSVRSSEPPNSFYNPSSTLQLGVENQLNLEINRQPEKRKESPSQGGTAQGHDAVVRNQQPSQGFVLIPQLGFKLNSKMLIPVVNVTATTDAVTQSYIKYQGAYIKNTTALSNTIPCSKLRRNPMSNISAASCSYVSNPKVITQSLLSVGAKTCNSSVNTESIKTHGNKESPLAKKVPSSSSLHPATEETKLEGKEECFCSVCNVDFGFPDRLEEHKNGNEFICRSCTAIFHNHQELETHFFSHKKFKCEFCKKSFYARMDLVDHKNTVLTCNKQSTKERCKICNTKFVSKEDVQLHMERRHPDGEPQPFTCSVCNSSYKIQHHLKRHMLMNHEVYESIECDICQQIIPGPTKLKLHIKGRHLQSPEVCPICKKVLTGKGGLKVHMQSHKGEEKICYICGAKVKGNANYRNHMYHHKDKRKTCGLCSITFNSSSEKNKHYREKHLKDKLTPAICELCGKEFKHTAILKNHMVTHSDVKPYECGVCGATFKTKTILTTHFRVHTDVKKFCCGFCGESFRWKPTFTKHLLKCESTQHGFKCEPSQNDDSGSATGY